MKKILILSILFLFGFALPSYAVEVNTQNKLGSDKEIITPTADQIQNRNKITTENKGEDQQLKVQNQEQENLANSTVSGEQNRNETTSEHMNVVAQKVHTLLQLGDSGFGQQVREVAMEQNQAQNQIRSQLDKVSSRSGLLKFLIGPDYNSLNNLQQQIAQNKLRIEKLTQFELQLTNQSDKDAVAQAIQALTQLNTSLQQKINTEDNSVSLFGWLFKLLAK